MFAVLDPLLHFAKVSACLRPSERWQQQNQRPYRKHTSQTLHNVLLSCLRPEVRSNPERLLRLNVLPRAKPNQI